MTSRVAREAFPTFANTPGVLGFAGEIIFLGVPVVGISMGFAGAFGGDFGVMRAFATLHPIEEPHFPHRASAWSDGEVSARAVAKRRADFEGIYYFLLARA